jgi:hypothetical protein
MMMMMMMMIIIKVAGTGNSHGALKDVSYK